MPGLLLRSFRTVYESAPRESAVSLVLQLVQGVATATQLLVVRNVLAAVVTGPPRHDYLPAVEQLAILVALQTVTGLIGTYGQMEQQVVAELVQRHASRPVTDVAAGIGLKEFDTPEFHDRMERAHQTAITRPLQVTNAVFNMGHSASGLLMVLMVLLILSPLLLAVAVLGFLPLWIATAKISDAVYDFMREMTPIERKRGYVLSILTSRDMAKEVRAFGLGRYFRDIYERLSDERIARLRQHMRYRIGISLAGSAASATAGGITLAILAWLIGTGRIGLAAAGAAALASLQLRAQSQGIAQAGGQLYECSLFIEDLHAFLELSPAVKARRSTTPAPQGFRRLEVKDVHFAYQTSPSPSSLNGQADVRGWGAVGEGPGRPQVLKGVSIELNQGEIVALVGQNGSGKTTLAKLICGLYAPDAGAILWDGTDVSRVDHGHLREQITVIFQDFVRYWLTARENIGIGRVAYMENEAAIKTAARHAGADQFIEAWAEGYDAVLAPIFQGGKELSVGQWQRVALARTFFRDAPLIILDEPTASLDARAEADLFGKIRTLFTGRSVLLISHRFSSVCSADRIYVMKDGEIIEQGSHEDLIKADGLYAELFNLQAAAYLNTRTPAEEVSLN